MKSILDPSFRYVPSVSTNLRKTFARVRRREAMALQEQAAASAPATPVGTQKVVPLDRAAGRTRQRGAKDSA